MKALQFRVTRVPLTKVRLEKGRMDWKKVREIQDKIERVMRDAYEASIDGIVGRITLKRLVELIEQGKPLAILEELGVSGKDFGDLADAAEEAFIQAAKVTAATMTLQNGAQLSGRFDMINPRVVDHFKTYRGNLITSTTNEVREQIMRVVQRAYLEGGHPYEQAREIKNLIGLTPRYEQAVRNYENALEVDARWTDEQITSKVASYADRLLRLRAETIARTESIRATSEGRLELWRQSADEGEIERHQVRRIWIVTPDDRLCPICESMGERYSDFETGVRLDEPYVAIAPSGASWDVETQPAHPNCRCAEGLVYAD